MEPLLPPKFSWRPLLLLTAGWLAILSPLTRGCLAARNGEVLDLTKQTPMDRDVRLQGGMQPWEGRIEIYSQISGQWHTHCNTPRREEFYNTVCRSIGFGAFVRDLPSKDFKKSCLVPLKGHFECSKDADRLRSKNCVFIDGIGCTNKEEVGIVCSGNVPSCGPISFPQGDRRVMHPFRLSYPVDARVNIKCPDDSSTSGVMRCVNGHWEWEGEEPCPHRGDDLMTCSAPVIDVRSMSLHPWKLYYLHDETLEVLCLDRSEKIKLKCGANGRFECADGEKKYVPELPTCNVYVVTHLDEKVFLVDGDRRNRGRILINRDGQWGSICADGWDLVDANVVCKQLGYGPARDLEGQPRFPPGSKRYLFREVRCSSSDTSILGCSMKHMSPDDKCLTDLEAEVDCFYEESPLFSFPSNCGPPDLPINALAHPLQHVYQVGEIVTLSCIGRKTEKVNMTCASDGLWRGDMIDCGMFPYIGYKWIIGGICVMGCLQVFITLIIVCCCLGRHAAAPAAKEKDDAPPPDNEVKLLPINQQTVLQQRRQQTRDNKED